MITPTRDQIIPWANLIFRSFLTHFAVNWIFYQKKGCRFSSPTILWLLVKSLETLIWVNMCYFGVFLTNFSSFFLKKKLQIFITNTMQILWTKRNNTFFLPQFKMFCWNLSQNVPFCLVSKNPFILMTSYGMKEGGLRKVRQNVKFRLSFINFTRKWL